MRKILLVLLAMLVFPAVNAQSGYTEAAASTSNQLADNTSTGSGNGTGTANGMGGINSTGSGNGTGTTTH